MTEKLTGLAGTLVLSFEREFLLTVVVLPVFETPLDFFFDFPGDGMFVKVVEIRSSF